MIKFSEKMSNKNGKNGKTLKKPVSRCQVTTYRCIAIAYIVRWNLLIY